MRAGAMVLSEESDVVNQWVEPYVDYVPFNTNAELVQRARYYLEHEDERLKIASQGYRRVMAEYSSEVLGPKMLSDMWNKSFYEGRVSTIFFDSNSDK